MNRNYAEELIDILPLIEKPSRYIGGEWNAIVKEQPSSTGERLTRVALAFPDTYELGMSHLGVKILYSILNAHPSVACERVFMPWRDMEAELRGRGVPLLSIESRRPLRDFDMVGFSLQYELSYTNLLAMLDLGGIPVRSEERREGHPLIVAGGPCAFNPEPLAPFIDVFMLGDAEESLLELTLALRQWRAAGLSREEVLREANRAREAYVPLLCRDVRDERTGLRHVPRVYVMKRTLKDIDRAPYPTALVVPYTDVVHDRVTFEVSRGCQVGCRFCQAGIIYRPARDREVETLLPIVEKSLASTGYDEISLMSLNAGGYPHIHEVARSLVERYKGENIAVALSSLRAPLLTKPLAEAVGNVRKTGFTIAAECGTERLRRIINKNIKHDDVLQAARNAYGNGWNLIKLYFMIGLPTEELDDVRAIVELGREVLAVGRSLGANPRVNLGVSCFVPKPHTPFQWLPMARPEELRERQDLLYRLTRGTPMKVKAHDIEQSALECVLSRGDRSVAEVVELAFRRGLRFDGWGEQFQPNLWKSLFREAEVDADRFCYDTWRREDPLPWDHIRTGVFKGFLWDELDKALRVEETPECGPDLCFSCGPCSKDFLADLKEKRSRPYPEPEGRGPHSRMPASFDYRVTYRKAGMLRFLSHLDLVRTWNRAVHRAALPMVYSKGFHPLPRISMGPALPVGVAGEGEVLDMELRSYLDPGELLARVAAVLPAELAPTDVVLLAADAPSLAALPLAGGYIADVAPLGLDDAVVAERVRAFVASKDVQVVRVKKGKPEARNVRSFVEGLDVGSDGLLRFRMSILPAGSISPFMAIAGILAVPKREAIQSIVTRTGLDALRGRVLRPSPERIREPLYAR